MTTNLLTVIAVLSVLMPSEQAEAQRLQSHDQLVAAHVGHVPQRPQTRLAHVSGSRFRDEADSLIEGAVIGGLIGGGLGAYVLRGMERFAGDNPSTKATIVGAVIGAAAGASLGMLVDHLLE